MKSKYYLALAFMALVFTSYTQEEFKCGTHEKLLKLYEEDPQLLKDHEELLKNALSVESKGN